LIAAAKSILGTSEGVIAVSVDPQMDAKEARKRISEAIKTVNDQGDGILILTDLFKGPHVPIALSLVDRKKVEVITGVNLPMILNFLARRRWRTLEELAVSVQAAGNRNIIRANRALLQKYQRKVLRDVHPLLKEERLPLIDHRNQLFGARVNGLPNAGKGSFK